MKNSIAGFLAGNMLKAGGGIHTPNHRYALKRAGWGLRQNLVAWWGLNEASLTRYDAHSGGYNLTDNNTVGSSTGKTGLVFAASFAAGSTESLSRADGAEFEFGSSSFSVAGWFRPTNHSSDQALVSKFNTISNNRSWHLGYGNTAGRYRFLASSDGTNTTAATANNHGAPVDGDWVHIAAYHDVVRQVIGIVCNGGLPDETSYTNGSVYNGNARLDIGCINGAGTPTFLYTGRMEQVALWSKALDMGEIQALYNNGNGMQYRDLLEY